MAIRRPLHVAVFVLICFQAAAGLSPLSYPDPAAVTPIFTQDDCQSDAGCASCLKSGFRLERCSGCLAASDTGARSSCFSCLLAKHDPISCLTCSLVNVNARSSCFSCLANQPAGVCKQCASPSVLDTAGCYNCLSSDSSQDSNGLLCQRCGKLSSTYSGQCFSCLTTSKDPATCAACADVDQVDMCTACLSQNVANAATSCPRCSYLSSPTSEACYACLQQGVAASSCASSRSARTVVVDFDDLDAGKPVPASYQGLQWSQWYAFNPRQQMTDIRLLYSPYLGVDRATYAANYFFAAFAAGVTSYPNAAYAYSTTPVNLTVATGTFDITSMVMTAVQQQTSLQLTGYDRSGAVLQQVEVSLSMQPQLFALNMQGMARLTLTVTGSRPQPGFLDYGGAVLYTMDDIKLVLHSGTAQ